MILQYEIEIDSGADVTTMPFTRLEPAMDELFSRRTNKVKVRLWVVFGPEDEQRELIMDYSDDRVAPMKARFLSALVQALEESER